MLVQDDRRGAADTARADETETGFGVRLHALQDLNLTQLRAEWRRLFRTAPPLLSRDLLLRGVAYRRQELQGGGLARSVHRRLKALKAHDDAAPHAPTALAIKAGSRLVREWHGRTHVVTVTDAGFDYDGRSYGSLTRIAREITGAHWSGPRFFGLVRLIPGRSKSGEPA